MTTLLGISGSLRRASTNTGLLRALKEMAPAHVTMEIADAARHSDVQRG